MNERIHTTPDGEQDRRHSGKHTGASDGGRRRPFLRALLSDRYSGTAGRAVRRRAGERLARGVRGLAYLGIGFLFGSCPLLFGTAPLGLALLAAASAHTWYILAGLVLSAFFHPVTLNTLCYLCLYTFCILLRLAVMFFVDPPLLPGEEIQPGLRGTLRYAKRYLGLCLSSAVANLGLHTVSGRREEEEEARDTRTDYYAGADPVGEKDGVPTGKGPRRPTDKPDGEGGTDAKVPRYRSACEARLFCEHPFLRTLTGAVSGFAAGAAGMVLGGFHFYDLFATLFLILAVPLATILLIPSFSEAGETLLFSPRPLHAGEDTEAPAQGHLTARFKILPLVSLSALILGMVFAARQFAPMFGTPYLTLRLSTLLGLIATLSAASRLGLLPGLTVSLLAGVGAGPTLLPLFILAAVAYGFLHILSHRAGIIGGCVAGLVWCAACGDLSVLLAQLPTLILTVPVYFLVERLWERMPETPEEQDMRLGDFSLAVAGENRLSDQCARLSSLSGAFAALSHQFYNLSGQLKQPRTQDLTRLCHQAFLEACASCPRRGSCPTQDGPQAAGVEQALSGQLCDRGSVSADRLPPSLQDVCPHMKELAADINTRYARLKESLIKGERIEVFAADYAHMAALLSDATKEDEEEYRCNREAADRIYDYLSSLGLGVQGVVVCGKRHCKVIVRGTRMDQAAGRAEEIRAQMEIICTAHFAQPEFEAEDTYTVMTLSSLPRMDAVFAGSTVPAGARSGDVLPHPLTNDPAGDAAYTPPAVCGDHIAIFKNQQACFYALISDGMGSGQEASETSDICAAFLEKMLSAGNRVEISLQMLNSFLRAKNAGCGEECSATVDLMELDMMGGHAVFTKNGAAPTYVVRGGTVYKLRSRSMPLGILRDSTPQMLRFRMHPGDVVVMVSDGVTLGNDECPWLIDLLSDPLPDSMDSLRLDILRRAIASGSPDDLSAIAIRVEDAK